LAVPTIESIFPSDTATGAILSTQVWANFDQEIDLSSLDGAFILVGPDSDLWTGPDMKLWNKFLTELPDTILRSPGYKGIVQGTWSISKLDGTGQSVSQPSYSPASGYKSRVIFTPTNMLAATTEYRSYLAGREGATNPIKGIRTRTIYDTQLGTNLGDGTVVSMGSYTGSTNKAIVFEITTAGGLGTAKFKWYDQIIPGIQHTGTVSGKSRHITEGLYIYFSGTDFRVGDTYTINLVAPEYMTNTYTWIFTTGSGSIISVPSTVSTSPTGQPVPQVPPYTTVAFAVEEVTPEHRATQIPLTQKQIRIKMTDTVDATTVTQDSVKVYAESILGDYDQASIQHIGEIAKKITVSGDTIIITI